ncbi:hypothetical protein BHE74_00030949, partial [Ensete ventricosum]
GFREEREIETPTPELIDLEAEWVSEPFDLNSGGLISPRECGSPPLLARHTDRRAPFAPFRPSDRTLQVLSNLLFLFVIFRVLRDLAN